MPSVDDLLGPPAESSKGKGKPSVDDLLGKPSQPDSFGSRLMFGIADPAVGAAQIGSRAVLDPPPIAYTDEQAAAVAPERHDEAVQGVDKFVQQRGQEYDQRNSKLGMDWARLLGNMAGTAPLAALPGGAGGLGARVAAGIGQGVAGGALQPVEGGNFGAEKAKQAGLGGVMGGAVGGVGAALSPIAEKGTNYLAQAWKELAKGIKATPDVLADRSGSVNIPIAGGGRIEPLPETPVTSRLEMIRPNEQVPGEMRPGTPVPQGGSVQPLPPAPPQIRTGPQPPPLQGQVPGPMRPGVPPSPGAIMRPEPGMPPQIRTGPQPARLQGQVPGPMKPGTPALPGGSVLRMPEAVATRDPVQAMTLPDAVKAVSARNVRVTPMQAAGRAEAERQLQKWPVLRKYVSGALGRGQDDFQRAIGSEALTQAGLGGVPRSVAAGHPLIDYTGRKLSDAYDRVLPDLTLSLQGAEKAIVGNQKISDMLSELPTDKRESVIKAIENNVYGRFRDPTMNGTLFKRLESVLSRKARDMGKQNDIERQNAYNDIIEALRGQLEVENPAQAPVLQKINRGWSIYKRMETAANRDIDGRGKFTPKDILATSRNAAGDAPLQAFAEAADMVMGPGFRPVPELGAHDYTIPSLTYGGLGTILYTGADIINRTPGAASLGRTLEGAAPLAGGLGGLGERRRRPGSAEMPH